MHVELFDLRKVDGKYRGVKWINWLKYYNTLSLRGMVNYLKNQDKTR